MGKLPLSLACWNYDRTRALMDGRVQVDGVDLTYLNLVVEETFFRMLRFQEFDAAEMSLSSYVMSLFSEKPQFIAIPVFPSRSFRHSCIFINRNSGIREPKDLIGKRIGMPEYQLTAPVWIRGILSDEYGVPVGDQVLYGVAQSLRLALREVDTVGRAGGEEFVVLAPETPPREAFLLAERLRRFSGIEAEVDRTARAALTLKLSLRHRKGVAILRGARATRPTDRRIPP